MRAVYFGPVAVFDGIKADKDQARKILEEAAEVFGAWQKNEKEIDPRGNNLRDLLDECCDLVTAVANLCAALGYSHMEQFMEDCKQKNIDRGRILKDDMPDDAFEA